MRSSFLPISLIFILLTMAACHPSSGERSQAGLQSDPEAREIVDRSIEAHGGSRYRQAEISFDFRGRHYRAWRQDGLFIYERRFVDDSLGSVTDRLSNEGFVRLVDGEEVDLPSERAAAYTSSTNSVLYFALLPYGLNDPAVIKTYLGETGIRGEPYQEIKVRFRKEGGGEDYEDVFIYWIHAERYTVDYLAYSYMEEEGPGKRFREAFNPREVSGIRFQDYHNYKVDPGVALEECDGLFVADSLELLSEIELEQIEVKLLEPQ